MNPHAVAEGTPQLFKCDSPADLFAEVFGPERGIGCRATIGVMCLAKNHCFETWMDLEVS